MIHPLDGRWAVKVWLAERLRAFGAPRRHLIHPLDGRQAVKVCLAERLQDGVTNLPQNKTGQRWTEPDMAHFLGQVPTGAADLLGAVRQAASNWRHQRRGASAPWSFLRSAVVVLTPGAGSVDDPPIERFDSWAATVGAFGVFDDDSEALLELEYRWDWHPYLPWEDPALAQFSGLLAVDESSLYLYGGLRYDLDLCERWRLTPSWATGLYEPGSGRDLGGAVQFRSKLEVSYRIH